MEDLRDGGDVPMWDGSQTPLEDFAEEVELCVLGTKLEFRGTCGPRHARARALSAQQRKHWRWAWG